MIQVKTVKMKNDDELCRACMGSAGTTAVLLTNPIAELYGQLIQSHVSLKDGLPQQFCSKCSKIILKLVSFRDMGISSEATLKYLYTSSQVLGTKIRQLNEIKTELEDSSDAQQSSTVDSVEMQNNRILELKFRDKLEINVEDDKDTFNRDEAFESKHDAVSVHSFHEIKECVLTTMTLRKKKIPVNSEANDNFPCGICEEIPLTKNDLKIHIESHKMDKACKICNKSFTDWPELLVHRYEHISHSGRFYECPLCSKKLRTLGTLNTHLRAVHNTGIECLMCSKVFFSSRKLQKHMYGHTNKNKFKCENCNKRFTTHRYLLIHSAIHSSEKNYACEFCDFRCKIPNGLRFHIKRKHVLGSFPCHDCNKVFTNEPALRDHKKNHGGTSMCPHCGIHVSNKIFKIHVRRHTNPRCYKCDLCLKEFATKQNMIYHINRHNGFKSNKCDFCSAKFYSKSVLIKHRRIHTGEKPYVCKICNKGFTGGNNLKVHMKVHGLLLVVKRDATQKASLAD